MLKHRVIPVLLFKDTGLVKGKRFNSWRRVGPAMPAIRVYEMRQVDELVFLDIGATPAESPLNTSLLGDVAEECSMPLAVGGGVRSIGDIYTLLLLGADKVVINTAAFERPEFIEEAAHKFGSQSIVVSIDVSDGEVVAECGQHQIIGRHPPEWARHMEETGAGEILLTSVDRDGMMGGYDTQLIKAVVDETSIPVIACGGAGKPEHFADALRAGAHAVAAASVFHFTELTPLMVKKYLDDQGLPVRP